MRVFIIGAGAQARLSHKILISQGHEVPYVYDRNAAIAVPWDCFVFHNEADIESYARQCDGFLVCVSDTKHGRRRVEFSRRLEAAGLRPVSAIHLTAFIAESAITGKGLQTYPRAIVNEFTVLSDYCILGSNCSIDHEGFIGNGVHIMGGAAIAGGVTVGDFCTIGTNATVLPNIHIGADSIIGAGAVVTKNVPANVTVAGNPARIIRDHRS